MVHPLGADWKARAGAEGGYSWGEFIGNVPELALNRETLHADLMDCYTWLVEEDDDEALASKHGQIIADTCRRLNEEDLSEGGKRFAEDFVVFTDFMEPASGVPNLGYCVSAEWLKQQKDRGLVPDYITLPPDN